MTFIFKLYISFSFLISYTLYYISFFVSISISIIVVSILYAYYFVDVFNYFLINKIKNYIFIVL